LLAERIDNLEPFPAKMNSFSLQCAIYRVVRPSRGGPGGEEPNHPWMVTIRDGHRPDQIPQSTSIPQAAATLDVSRDLMVSAISRARHGQDKCCHRERLGDGNVGIVEA
jgi:hypothetical protein